MLLRIREQLNEPTAALWNDNADYGLTSWYDEGAFKQHRIVLDRCAALGLLQRTEHEYLRYFVKESAPATFTAGTQDIALPTGFWRYIARVTVGTGPERIAEPRPIEHDHFIRHIPQYQPTPEQPYYAVVPSGDAAAKIRFYVYGDRTLPAEALAYKIQWYRDVTATAGNTNVDLPDPFNDGPVYWACYRACLKERTRADEFMELFQTSVANIVGSIQFGTEPVMAPPQRDQAPPQSEVGDDR